MSNTMGKIIHILPQGTNDNADNVGFLDEDTNFIQDHGTFEDRRRQLISEYERELRIFKSNSMLMT
ncbi:hypothetical protein [Clostridium sp. BNL1100]|uniref:hypothetical protein n=1 Tax=Clostridium sp. BNL1100 TaxID=755731 RepID=UPI00024A750A|nr:hypothetical protein [Clostridium sp. BNL1100]AEY66861.1 hypothetical protein Clo1100_2701 [Clostridium sp. BNL1100]